ncbi:hypothetical protein [Candidatus Palauibacter sp.]|uniref:hypothetical protein n=1 Tax=Candidatus Palauibacter sp. TaxID=3101350 RepID=UPI003B01BADF
MIARRESNPGEAFVHEASTRRLAQACMWLAGFAVSASCVSFTVQPANLEPRTVPGVAPGADPGEDPTITTTGGIGVEPRDPRDLALVSLHELLRLQDAFHRRHARYARFLEDLDFRGSRSVQVRIVRATADGWSATARVPEFRLECAVFQGNVASPRPYASRPGEPACSP